jgi:hypothetical protein
MWKRAKAIGVPVRGWVEGRQCRVEMFTDGNTAWQVKNHARNLLQYSPQASTPAPVADDAGYSHDTWAQDEALTDEGGRYFDSSSLPYILSIYDEARARGYDAQWRRVDYTSQQWRVAVWEVSQQQFSELLSVASSATSEALAA